MRWVLDPDFDFEALADTLARAGWQREETPLATPPLRPGEPELARWTRDGQSLAYSFNPVVSLRVLSGAAPPASLPVLDSDAVAGLLRSPDPRRALCGALAAAELGLAEMIPLIRPLREHADPAAARLARGAIERLEAEAPGRAPAIAIFDTLSAPQQRQVLRWMLAERPGAAAPVIARALASDDVELAATAVIAAARLGLDGLRDRVAAARLADRALSRRDRQFLEAARRAALATLAGTAPGPGDDTRTRLWRAVLGVDGADDAFRMAVAALTTPLPDIPLPKPPKGLDRRDGEALLAPLGLVFRPVPRVAHWLGHDLADGRPNPARRWTPDAPYWIMAEPLPLDAARRLAPVPEGLGTACVTAETADAIVARARALTGLSLALPGADEWEAALRGPDGRAHPWGLLPRPRPGEAHSPWGIMPGPPGVGEWTRDHADRGRIVCGLDRAMQPAFRAASAPDARHALRFVLSAPA